MRRAQDTFQTWFEKDLKPGEWDNDGRREIYKKAQLTFEQHFELFDFSKKNKRRYNKYTFFHQSFYFLLRKSYKLKYLRSPSSK